MRLRKSLFVILLLSFGLTGCYTQLEYSQKMNRVTDDKTGTGYSWSDEEEKANLTEADSIYIAETYGAKVAPYREEDGDEYIEDEYITIPYKDYEVLKTYEECGCDPYKEYTIYNNYYPSYWGYSSYYSVPRYFGSSYYAFGPHYNYWRYVHGYDHFRRGYGAWYYLTFYGGSLYGPFYFDPFYYGYYPYYNSFYASFYYSNFYYGGGYYGSITDRRSDRRYGPRSIGADRVRDRSTTVRNRSDITRSRKDGNTVRSRTIGAQRTRGTIQRNGNTTTRSRGTIGSSSRTRSDSGTRTRGTVRQSGGNDSGNSATRSRSGSGISSDRDDNRQRARTSSLGVNRNNSLMQQNSIRIDRSELESRIRQQRVKTLNDPQTRRSFFGRFRSMFDNGSYYNNSKFNTRSNRSFNTSSRNRTKVGSSSRSSSSSRSTVTRSRSSSKSSGSRSRGSSSSRSRGNNN